MSSPGGLVNMREKSQSGRALARSSRQTLAPIMDRSLHALSLASLVLVATARPARASSGIDFIEHIFGASAVNACTGHGRMAVGVARDGDLVVLGWPNASFADQLGFIAGNDLDVRTRPRYGAPDGAGSFLGLVVDAGGGARTVTWLHDPKSWDAAQSYGPDDGANVHTVFEPKAQALEALGLRVTLVDAVKPRPPGETAGDVLVRRVRVERAPGKSTKIWLLTYANLSPVPPSSHVPELPLADWGMDGRNDYAAVWSAADGAVVHFHPGDQRLYSDLFSVAGTTVSWGVVGGALQAGTPDASAVAGLAARLDADHAPGAYLALTTVPAPDQHQIGYDATPFCGQVSAIIDNILELPEHFPAVVLPVPKEALEVFRCPKDAAPIHVAEGWKHTATDALADAGDGELEGSSIAAGEVNEALRTPLVFETRAGIEVADAAVVLAAGATAKAALDAAAEGAADPDAVLAAAEKAFADWVAPLRLPEKLGTEARLVARRALANVRVGTDAATGAIVASIARQAPYGLDWPRDGAFFNVALDVSGQADEATRRTELYAAWQRSEPVAPSPLIGPEPPVDPDTGDGSSYPADGWEMNYYADGVPGGPYRFEIDNAGFALWSTVAHAGWVSEPALYLEKRWSTIARAASLLARWRDATTGLQAPAQEDDSPASTQTLHGAVTTFGALETAARAARLLGRLDAAAPWETRAAELRDAILGQLHDPVEGRFINNVPTASSVNPGSAPTGPTAWLVWPMRLLPWSDERLQDQLAFDLEAIGPTVRLENEGGAYYMKNTLALALAWGADPARRPSLDALFTALTNHATPATRQFGEVMVVAEDESGGRRPDQRVSNPHLWEGTLFYLTAMALEDPAALLRYDEVLPPAELGPAPAPAPEPAGGCGCRMAPPRRGLHDLALVGAALALFGRRLRPLRQSGAHIRQATRWITCLVRGFGSPPGRLGLGLGSRE
jgi:hypothetical protein